MKYLCKGGSTYGYLIICQIPVFVMKNSNESKKSGLSESFVMGVIALVFLMVGYQTAMFIHRAAVVKIAANRDSPDTVYVYCDTSLVVRNNAAHSSHASSVRKKLPFRNVESFHFNPNTVSVEDLCRLGFTVKQAESIDNYRKKGGKFRRKGDFAKSYVVSDSVYERLEPYISIPLIDLNQADSAAFDSLPGIGGWFAAKMIEYRETLGGYSCKEQLMDIYRFDQEKFDALSDLVTVSEPYSYPLWTLPADSLRRHPYIRDYETARSIVLYRENNPIDLWTVRHMEEAGIISAENALKLGRCVLRQPSAK